MITANNSQVEQDLFVIETEERLETIQVAAEAFYDSCSDDTHTDAK